MIKYLIIPLFAFLSTALIAQRSIFYDYSYIHKPIYNPAYAGINPGVLNLSVKKQWIGVDFSPSTQILSLYGKVSTSKKTNHEESASQKQYGKAGLGVLIYSDKNGVEGYTGGQIMYSYTFSITHDVDLSFGLSATLTQYQLNQNMFIPYHSDDPLIDKDKETHLIPDFNFGGIIHKKDKYQIGFAFTELIKSNLLPENYQNKLNERDKYLSCQYTFKVSDNWIIEPYFLLRNADSYNMLFNGMIKIDYLRLVYLSVGYRSDEAILGYFGINKNRCLMGYSFDLSIGEMSNYCYGSHMLFINFKL